MHELKEFVDHSLEEPPVSSQEAWVLTDHVHDVGRNDGLVVLASLLFTQSKQVLATTTHFCSHSPSNNNTLLFTQSQQQQHTSVHTVPATTTHFCSHSPSNNNTLLFTQSQQQQHTSVHTVPATTTHFCSHSPSKS